MGEPTAIGDLLGTIGEKWRFRRRLPGGLVFRDSWEVIVGARMAAHCMPLRVKGSELVLAVDSPAWLQELGYAQAQLERAIIAQIRAPKIKRIKLVLAPLEFAALPQAGLSEEKPAQPLPEPTKEDHEMASLITEGLEPSLAEAIKRAYLKSAQRKRRDGDGDV